MPTSSPEGTTRNATFIFRGTVRKIKSATMKNVPVNNQTVVVTVDQVIEAPKILAKLAGAEITVQLPGHQKVVSGDTKIFHTNGWIFGDSVAVQCVSTEAVKITHAALLSRGGNPIEHRRDRVVQDRFADSDTVVSGTVAEVKLPDQPSPSRGKAAARAATEPIEFGPISEHNPHWRDAVIVIDNTHKGATGQNRMVIRFPASMDVRWYKAPKFTPGQQGFFMMKKTKVTKKPTTKRAARKGGGPALAAAAEKPGTEEVYTCLHPEDFQSYSEPGGIKRIVNTSGDEPEG